jgi:3,4-dihydroxy 2-butanone 4-phosphate synthase/GTP cyclohydrolase II
MARLPDLIRFAQLHGMKIGTIADLIAYRRRTERFVERVLETPFQSDYGGEFRMVIYRNLVDGAEHFALVRGKVDSDKPTLVRMHAVDITADILGRSGSRTDYARDALKAIAANPDGGVAVFIRDLKPTGLSERYGAGPSDDPHPALRDYGVGAQILLDLGVRDMVLLTATKVKPAGLDGFGLRIVDRRPIPPAED